MDKINEMKAVLFGEIFDSKDGVPKDKVAVQITRGKDAGKYYARARTGGGSRIKQGKKERVPEKAPVKKKETKSEKEIKKLKKLKEIKKLKKLKEKKKLKKLKEKKKIKRDKEIEKNYIRTFGY
jgi:hypothetical protein